MIGGVVLKSVIIATKNAGKAKDFERILKPYGVEVKTLLDFPSIEDVEETGKNGRALHGFHSPTIDGSGPSARGRQMHATGDRSSPVA